MSSSGSTSETENENEGVRDPVQVWFTSSQEVKRRRPKGAKGKEKAWEGREGVKQKKKEKV